MTSPEWQQQQKKSARSRPYAPQPSPNMGMHTPLPSPPTFRNKYFYGESYLDMVPQYSYYDDQIPLAMTATFTPHHIVQQQNITALPPAHQNSLASAQAAHPSDVVGSLDEAMAAMPQRDWHCPQNDMTLPATDQDREHWVQMLLNAVNNLTDIQGNQGPDYYLPVDKFTLCWIIEDLAERLHHIGPSVLHSFDDNFWEQAAKTHSWTFQDRMTRIVELLAVSKTRCDSLLGDKGLQGIVANPGEKIVATKLQAKQNAKRGKVLQAGRAVRKQETGRVAKRQKTSARK